MNANNVAIDNASGNSNDNPAGTPPITTLLPLMASPLPSSATTVVTMTLTTTTTTNVDTIGDHNVATHRVVICNGAIDTTNGGINGNNNAVINDKGVRLSIPLPIPIPVAMATMQH